MGEAKRRLLAGASRFPKPEAKRVNVENPLILCYPEDHLLRLRFHPRPGYTPANYGQMVVLLVRSMAESFKVPESAVWEWVEHERAALPEKSDAS